MICAQVEQARGEAPERTRDGHREDALLLPGDAAAGVPPRADGSPAREARPLQAWRKTQVLGPRGRGSGADRARPGERGQLRHQEPVAGLRRLPAGLRARRESIDGRHALQPGRRRGLVLRRHRNVWLARFEVHGHNSAYIKVSRRFSPKGLCEELSRTRLADRFTHRSSREAWRCCPRSGRRRSA